jgi:hypothetical protein
MMLTNVFEAENIALQTSSGYWSSNNHYFFDKAECLRYASSCNSIEVKYHYFDSFYSSLNWKNESPLSLKTLYKDRAEQLRSKYDFIVVAYSGGADSNNVIDSFLDNGIHIDEIVTTYPIQAIEKLKPYFDRTNRKASNLIFEYSEAAEPKLKEIANKFPKIKISCLDHTTHAIDLILQNKLHTLPVSGLGASPSLAGHNLIGELLRKYNDKGSTALLTGCDKPRMAFYPGNKKFYVYFDDVTTVWGNYNSAAFAGFKPKTEHFYYTVDMPELWQKQCFILKRIMEPICNREIKCDFYDKITVKTPSGADAFLVHDIFFKKILYEQWSEFIFQAEKPSGYFFQEHSNWFFKSPLVSQKERDFHYGQVMEMIHGINPKFINYDSTGKPLKFIEMHSKPIPMT